MSDSVDRQIQLTENSLAVEEKASKDLPKRWTSWMHNVVDKYKGMPVEDIKNDLVQKALPCAVFMSQIEGDFNFGNVIRTANAYNLSHVYYYGKKRFDRRGCVGTNNYVNITYLSSIDQVKYLKTKYNFVGLENNIKKVSVDINNYIWKANSMILIGEESNGIPEEIIDLCDDLVEIKTFGSVRSLNAATAAAIAMDKLSTQFRR